MWVAYMFIAYLLLALTIPVGLSLAPVWRRRRGSKEVRCPVSGGCCSIALDHWHAVRMHALGEYELRVKSCTGWPERCDCAQECLAQVVVEDLR